MIKQVGIGIQKQQSLTIPVGIECDIPHIRPPLLFILDNVRKRNNLFVRFGRKLFECDMHSFQLNWMIISTESNYKEHNTKAIRTENNEKNG